MNYIFQILYLLVVLVFASATANADVFVTYSPGVDGGVVGRITGSGSIPESGSVNAIILDDLSPLKLLKTTAPPFVTGADTLSGGVNVGVFNPGFRALINATVNRRTDPSTSDEVRFDFEGSFAGTSTYDLDATATWNVGTLEFADLNPGTYSVSGGSVNQEFGISFASITVVPEPAATGLLFLVGVLAIAKLGRIRRKP